MSPYEKVEVSAPAPDVVAALRDELRTRGATEYVVVDHGHDMAAAGAPSHPAWTLIFGNPAGGEKLLAQRLEAVVDIPLRLGVIGTGEQSSAIIIRPMRSLLGDDLGDLPDRFTDALRDLAATARAATEARA
jgi:uncharacterized protein (DUF302 family)